MVRFISILCQLPFISYFPNVPIICSVCGSSIAFYFVGYAFAFGGDPGKVSFIGSSNFLLLDAGSGDTKALIQIHWFFQFAFAATAGEYYI